jgi:glycosyltransferase involved in cell wall biosynthesis
MPLISLAMIVKNEEASLAHCLESVKPLVDEMIVVDTGSTDRTIDIANDFGAQVHNFKWCDDFAAARNESLKHCNGEWVLILDADEAIDPLDYEKIKNACTHPWADAYSLIHRHYTFSSSMTILGANAVPNKSKYGEGKDLPFFGDTWTARLARMFRGLSFTRSIHETLDSSVQSQGRTIAELDAVIHHYGKLLNDRTRHKIRYYFMLAQQEAKKRPKDKWAHYNVLQQALLAEQWEVAIRAAQKYMDLDINANPFVVYGGGQALQELGRHREAIKYFDVLLSQAPKYVLAMVRKGLSYKALGNVDAARQLMTEAIELDPACIQAYGCLAELEFSLNNFDAARRTVLDAIKIAPNEPVLYNLLVKTEMARSNHRQAGRDAMLGLQNCPNESNNLWYRLAAVYLSETGKHENAKAVLESGLKAFPDDPGLARLKKMI